MKLKENIQPQEFISAIDKTQGTVMIKNKEGNQLNVKSQFCQYIFISILLEPDLLRECWVECEYKEDAELLKMFLTDDSCVKKLEDYNS